MTEPMVPVSHKLKPPIYTQFKFYGFVAAALAAAILAYGLTR